MTTRAYVLYVYGRTLMHGDGYWCIVMLAGILWCILMYDGVWWCMVMYC